jgi:hypothetical protein
MQIEAVRARMTASRYRDLALRAARPADEGRRRDQAPARRDAKPTR